MKSNENKFFSAIFGIMLLVASVITFFVGVPAAAQEYNDALLVDLRANPKLRAPDDILADFTTGKPETRVIVVLKPSAAADDLAARSRLSGRIPSEFLRAGAPAYYNLRDEYVRIRLRATVTETIKRVLVQLGSSGITVTQKFSYQFGFAAKVTPEALERIVSSPDVVAVEKDHIGHWDLAQGIPLINAATVRSTYTGAGVSIALCDSGIDTSHPRLGGGGFPNSKVLGGYDIADNDSDPRPDSMNGEAHGSACAGIAAGNIGTVGDYIGGVAPDAKLYALKISTDANPGFPVESALINAWNWCVDHQNDDPNNPITVISTSASVGGPFSSSCDSSNISMTTAAGRAVSAGITIFASSGNNGYCDSINLPACISYVNSVGSVYDDDFGINRGCISYSSCAPKILFLDCPTHYLFIDFSAPDMVPSYSNSASILTLLAPSNQAYTTDIVGPGGYNPSGDYFATFGGTSAACPYAAGAAAVLQQAAKAKSGFYLTPAQVKAYLVDNGDDVTDSKSGITTPRINLGRAVDAIPSGGGASNLLINAGFENGQENWTQYSSGGYDIIWEDASEAHDGNWFARMGGYDNATEYIYQDVTVPPDITQAELQFWYNIATEETSTINAWDTMSVEVRRPTDNALLSTIDVFSNLDHTSGWQQSPSYDLSPFKGEAIRLRFYATTDYSFPTEFHIDDVELMTDSALPPTGSVRRWHLGSPIIESTIANAFANAIDGDTIEAWGLQFNDPSIRFSPVAATAVKFSGGWDDGFANQTSMTTLRGLTIGGGASLTIENLIIQ